MTEEQQVRIYRLHGGPADGKIVFEPAAVERLCVPHFPPGGGFERLEYNLRDPGDATELSVDDLVSLQEPGEPLDGYGLRLPEDPGGEWKR